MHCKWKLRNSFMNKLNVIYIHTHDSGRYTGPYGYNVPTPNLNRFALESTTFRHCFSAAPTCSPSRAALLTGMTPHQCGMQGLVNRGWHLCDSNKHLASFLHSKGYETILCGMQHEGKSWRELGYETHIGHEESVKMSRDEWDRENTESIVSYLENRNSDKPFFLSLGWFNTHRPYPHASEEINPDFIEVPPILPDCSEVRKDMADYYQSISVVDECFGKIYDAIRRLGLLDNSIVFFTTDHGIAFPMMKCSLFDTGIGVSFMFSCPDNKLKGRAVDNLISHYDVFPTLCDFLGIEKPEWIEGHSFAPLFEGKDVCVRKEVCAEVTYHASYEPKRCIRTDRYKYIRLFYSPDVIPSNIDEEMVEIICSGAKDLHDAEKEVIIVPGAGNLWRGRQKDSQMDAIKADQIGMLGINMNALAIGEKLDRMNIANKVVSCVPVEEFGIDRNDPANGILLPNDAESPLKGSLHLGGHTQEYYNTVEQRMMQATTREEALEVLQSLKEDLYSGEVLLHNDVKPNK